MKTFLLAFTILIASHVALAQNDCKHSIDSLLQVVNNTQGKEKLAIYEELAEQMFYYEKNLDTILDFFKKWEKEAEKQKKIELQARIKYSILAALVNHNKDDEFLKLVFPCLDFLRKHEMWKYYDYLQNGVLRTYIRQGRNVEAIQHAKKLYDETILSNREEGTAVAYRMLALAYISIGRYNDAEEKARKSVEILEKIRPVTPMLDEAYMILTDALSYQKKYAEALEALKQWEAVLRKLDITMYDYYWIGAILYINMDNFSMGEKYLQKADSIEEAQTERPRFARDLYWAKIMEAKNDYKQALDLINATYEENTTDLEILPLKARLLCKMGRGEEAYPLYERLQEAQDSLQKIYFSVQLDELRTQYEVDKHIAEKKRNRNYFLFTLGGCVLLTLALGVWIYLNRKIAKKNRTLAQQIKELTAQQEEQVKEMLTKTSFVPEAEKPEAVDEDLCHESRMDKLCIALRDLMLKDKIYRNPAITQELVIETLNANRRTFAEAFEFCFQMQFKDYVNFLRLKDAVILLEQSDFTIEEIADTSGFGTVRTFQRQFSAKYNMSPKEYRGLMVNDY
jgi:AraC-like DNA-binding protein